MSILISGMWDLLFLLLHVESLVAESLVTTLHVNS